MNKYKLLSYISMMTVGGFMGFLDYGFKDYELWVIVIGVAFYGLFNRLEVESKYANEEAKE